MEILQAFRYRLDPTREQEILFRKTAGCCRWVYNWGLAARRKAWSEEEKTLGYTALANQLPALKRRVGTAWLMEVPSHCLQQALRDLDQAYVNLFGDLAKVKQGVLKSVDVRRPRYRKKGQRDTFRFPDPTQIRLEGNRLFLPKARWVRLRLSRSVVGTIRQVTVVRDGEHWYASILTAREVPEPTVTTDREVGLDFGVAQTITTHTGQVYQVTHLSPGDERHCKRLKRRLSRRMKGSNRWYRARSQLARFERCLRNRRHDQLHKITTELVQNHDVLYLEDLAVQHMTASAKGTLENPGRSVRAKAGLNRSILRQGWGLARRMLEYKAGWAGKEVVVVPPAYTSQRCMVCGHTEAGNRPSQSRFRCLSCGHEAHADENAALNILAAGRAATGRGADVRPTQLVGSGDEAATPRKAVA